jgi:hypothetical protein
MTSILRTLARGFPLQTGFQAPVLTRPFCSKKVDKREVPFPKGEGQSEESHKHKKETKWKIADEDIITMVSVGVVAGMIFGPTIYEEIFDSSAK